jgi:hypothetical protein
MHGRRVSLLRQILLFVLVTLLGLATGYLTNERRPPGVLGALERSALPLAGVIAGIVVAVSCRLGVLWGLVPGRDSG